MSWKLLRKVQCIAILVVLSVFGSFAWAGSMEVEGDTQAELELFVDGEEPGTGSGLGKVEFHGNNDAAEAEKIKYASIDGEISNASDGAESAKLVVRTQVSGTDTDILEIDGSGLAVKTGGLDVTGAAAVSGAATVGSTLGVTGLATLNGGLDVTGDAGVSGAVTGGNVVAKGGTVTVESSGGTQLYRLPTVISVPSQGQAMFTSDGTGDTAWRSIVWSDISDRADSGGVVDIAAHTNLTVSDPISIDGGEIGLSYASPLMVNGSNELTFNPAAAPTMTGLWTFGAGLDVAGNADVTGAVTGGNVVAKGGTVTVQNSEGVQLYKLPTVTNAPSQGEAVFTSNSSGDTEWRSIVWSDISDRADNGGVVDITAHTNLTVSDPISIDGGEIGLSYASPLMVNGSNELTFNPAAAPTMTGLWTFGAGLDVAGNADVTGAVTGGNVVAKGGTVTVQNSEGVQLYKLPTVTSVPSQGQAMFTSDGTGDTAWRSISWTDISGTGHAEDVLDTTHPITISGDTIGLSYASPLMVNGSHQLTFNLEASPTMTGHWTFDDDTGLDVTGSGGLNVTGSGGLDVSYGVSAGSVTAGNSVSVENASAATVETYVNAADPSSNPGLGTVRFHGENASDVKVEYARIEGTITDPTATTEDAKVTVRTMVNGTDTEIVEVDGSGLAVKTGGLDVAGDVTVGEGQQLILGTVGGDVKLWESSNNMKIEADSSVNIIIDESDTGTGLFNIQKGTGGSTDLVTVTNAGRVGIGTYAPFRTLDVRANHFEGGAAFFYNGTIPANRTSDYYGIQIRCGMGDGTGTNKHIVLHNGNGTECGGVGLVGGVPALWIGSDARLKENIVPTTHDCMYIVKNLPVRDYKYLDTKGSPESERPILTGFVAQELEAVYPEAVIETLRTNVNYIPTTVTLEAGTVYEGRILKEAIQVVRLEKEPEETYKAIMPMRLIPILVGAVQEQQGAIDSVVEDLKALSEATEAATKQALSAAAAAQVGGQSDPELSDAFLQEVVDAVFVELGVDRWVEISLADAWEEVDEVEEREVLKTVTEYRMNWDTMAVETVEVTKTVVESASTGKKVRRFKAGVRFDETDGKFYKRVFLDDPDLSSIERALTRRQIVDSLRRAFQTCKTSEVRD